MSTSKLVVLTIPPAGAGQTRDSISFPSTEAGVQVICFEGRESKEDRKIFLIDNTIVGVPPQDGAEGPTTVYIGGQGLVGSIKKGNHSYVAAIPVADASRMILSRHPLDISCLRTGGQLEFRFYYEDGTPIPLSTVRGTLTFKVKPLVLRLPVPVAK